jgi:hypothetical protein
MSPRCVPFLSNPGVCAAPLSFLQPTAQGLSARLIVNSQVLAIFTSLQMIVAINIFLKFTLWGYTLPPRPTREELHQWHSKMGFFMVHKLAVCKFYAFYPQQSYPSFCSHSTVNILLQPMLMWNSAACAPADDYAKNGVGDGVSLVWVLVWNRLLVFRKDEFFKWTKSPIACTYIPTRGLHVFVSDVETVQHVLTDKVLFPTRGWTGFNTWVPNGLLAIPTGVLGRLEVFCRVGGTNDKGFQVSFVNLGVAWTVNLGLHRPRPISLCKLCSM